MSAAGLLMAERASVMAEFSEGGTIWYAEVNCTGSETNLTQCPNRYIGDTFTVSKIKMQA